MTHMNVPTCKNCKSGVHPPLAVYFQLPTSLPLSRTGSTGPHQQAEGG